MRGVLTFKDTMVYANSSLSHVSLPQNEDSQELFECYRGGNRVASHTSVEIADKASSLWDNHFSQSSGDVDDGKLFNYEVRSGQTAKPVFMSLDMETPLGFSSFLANASNHRKVFIPSTFNMSTILKSVSTQESVDLVCDQAFFEIDLPEASASEYKDKCSNVSNVIVAGSGSGSSSKIFGGRPTVMDPLNF